MSEYDIIITCKVDDEFVSNVLITAYDGSYGGCRYWSGMTGLEIDHVDDCSALLRPSEVCTCPWKSLFVKLQEDVDENRKAGQEFYMDAEKIVAAMQAVITHYGHQDIPAVAGYIMRAVREGDAGDIDTDAADLIVQFACFGELVFG